MLCNHQIKINKNNPEDGDIQKLNKTLASVVNWPESKFIVVAFAFGTANSNYTRTVIWFMVLPPLEVFGCATVGPYNISF